MDQQHSGLHAHVKFQPQGFAFRNLAVEGELSQQKGRERGTRTEDMRKERNANGNATKTTILITRSKS